MNCWSMKESMIGAFYTTYRLADTKFFLFWEIFLLSFGKRGECA
jgi:hypothetical protein